LQLAAEVAAPPVHEADRQDVADPGYAQALLVDPLQLPPHRLPSLEHGGRAPMGEPATAEQVPTEPERAHASHCPPHVELQQTPSTQLPEMQAFAAVHAVPFASFVAQDPPLQ
jgi:hypothetical protein